MKTISTEESNLKMLNRHGALCDLIRLIYWFNELYNSYALLTLYLKNLNTTVKSYSPHPQLSFLHFPLLHFPKLVHSRLALRGQFTARPKQKNPKRNNGRTPHPIVVISIPPLKSFATAATKNTIPTLANACFHIHAERIQIPLHARIKAARRPAIRGAVGNTHHHNWLQKFCHAKSIVTPRKKIIVPHPNLAILIQKRLQLVHSVVDLQLIWII